MKERIILFKFFKGEWTERMGVRNSNYLVGHIFLEGNNGISCIVGPQKEGKISNNMVWYKYPEDNEDKLKELRLEALYQFRNKYAKDLIKTMKLMSDLEDGRAKLINLAMED